MLFSSATEYAIRGLAELTARGVPVSTLAD